MIMKKRGPKSGAELVVVDERYRRPPPPPAELSDAQSQVWRDTVGALRGDWLNRASFPLLVEYARHVCRSRMLEGMIAEFEVEWIKHEGGLRRLNLLLAMAERQTRAIASCARALRLSPSSQMHARSAARRLLNPPADMKRPWDEDFVSTK